MAIHSKWKGVRGRVVVSNPSSPTHFGGKSSGGGGSSAIIVDANQQASGGGVSAVTKPTEVTQQEQRIPLSTGGFWGGLVTPTSKAAIAKDRVDWSPVTGASIRTDLAYTPVSKDFAEKVEERKWQMMDQRVKERTAVVATRFAKRAGYPAHLILAGGAEKFRQKETEIKEQITYPAAERIHEKTGLSIEGVAHSSTEFMANKVFGKWFTKKRHVKRGQEGAFVGVGSSPAIPVWEGSVKQATEGAMTGFASAPIEHPLKVASFLAAGFAMPHIGASVKISGMTGFLKAAPFIHPVIRAPLIELGGFGAFSAKAGLVGAYSYTVGKRVAMAPNAYEKGKVFGGVLSTELLPMTVGGIAAYRSPTMKPLQQELLYKEAQVQLLPYKSHLKTAGMRIDVTRKLSKGTITKEQLGTYDAKKLYPRLTSKEARFVEQQVQNKLIYGSPITKQGKPSDIPFYEAGSIKIKMGVGVKGYKITGTSRVLKDVDIALKWRNPEKFGMVIQKGTHGKLAADPHKYSEHITHAFSRRPEKIPVKSGGKTFFSTKGEQLGRKFEGMYNVREGTFYRFPKDVPDWTTEAKTLATTGVTRYLRRPLTTKGEGKSLLKTISKIEQRDLIAADKDVFKFWTIKTEFPSQNWATVVSGSSKPPVTPTPVLLGKTPKSSIFKRGKSSYVGVSKSRSSSLSKISSLSTSPSKSRSPSISKSPSLSRSLSKSLSPSRSYSPSQSKSPSPSISPSLSKSPSFSPTSYYRTKPPLIPRLPKLFPSKSKFKGFKVPRQTKYQPSLVARALNIKRKRKPKRLTGLGVRPLVI